MAFAADDMASHISPTSTPKVLGRSTWLSCRLPPFIKRANSERVIGHRGSRGTMPENTRMAFREAWDHGCRVLETDAQVTADDVVVCFHDATLERTTGLPGTVRDYTYAQLKEKALIHGPHGTKDSIMPLEEMIYSFPYANIIIDLKNAATIDPLVKVINTTHSAGRICVSHSWDSWLEAIRDQVSPLLQRNLGWETMAALIKCAREGIKPDSRIHVANWVHIAYEDNGLSLMKDPKFSTRLISMANDLGMGVRVWTVNDFNEAIRLWDEGADAVFTDYPKQMVKLAQQRQSRAEAAKILNS